jgi:PKHD-type hydroxylase
MIHPPIRQEYYPYYYYESAFDNDECHLIKTLGIESGLIDSNVANGSVNKDIRNSQNSWIKWGQESDWVYQKLTNLVNDCNGRIYQFDINGFFEDLQFTKYGEGCYYNYHEDLGAGQSSIRKLSMVVQLSDEKEYEGGELVLFSGNEKMIAPKKQGTVIFFPSYVTHKVSKVISGERFSLVAWLSGTPFR